MSAATKPPSLAHIYLRGALGLFTKKKTLGPEVTKLYLPEETLNFSIDPKHVGDFIRVVDNSHSSNKQTDASLWSSEGGAVPITYLQCLLNGMPMNLMTHSEFPMNIVGSVHESVRIESKRPVKATEDTSSLFARCHMAPEISLSNKNDWIFTVVTDIMNGEDEDDKIMSIANAYRILNPQRHKVQVQDTEQPPPPDYFQDSDWEPINTWSFPANTGRRYAALNGDINPIHIHPLAGMVFGYKSCIAHGMYSVCALLQEPRFAERSITGSCTVTAQFTRPLLLPAKEVYSFQQKGTNNYVIGTQNKEGQLKETVKGTIEFD